MATKNEKSLALCLTMLLNQFDEIGLDIQEDSLEFIKGELNRINSEEETSPAARGSGGDRFSYEGLNVLDMTKEEREELGVCEFKVRKGGELVLQVFWDSDLELILQPNEDFTEFTPAYEKKFPKGGAARILLKNLAEQEIENPGSFAKQFYKKRKSVYVRKAIN